MKRQVFILLALLPLLIAEQIGVLINSMPTAKDIEFLAKYFRALPLHHSQQEVIHDDYSVFSYWMRITYDLKEEIMSHGASIEVLEPAELKTLIRTELEQALKNYG